MLIIVVDNLYPGSGNNIAVDRIHSNNISAHSTIQVGSGIPDTMRLLKLEDEILISPGSDEDESQDSCEEAAGESDWDDNDKITQL